MAKPSYFFLFLLAAFPLVWLSSCQTDDVEPAVAISVDSVDNNRFSENGGRAYLTATLNAVSDKEVVVSLVLSGSGERNKDYTVSATEIRIPAGKSTGTILFTGINDNDIEGDETVLVAMTASNAQNLEPQAITLVVSDDDSDTDKDGVNDGDDGCPLDSGSVSNAGCPPGYGLIFNEVLYDPSSLGLLGDANGDGVVDKYQDGFVEIVNNTVLPKDLSGYSLSDVDVLAGTSTLRYSFPPGTVLPPKKAAVVFGGGTPTGTFGNALVLLVGNSAGLSMNNSGERIQLSDPLGTVILTFDSDALSNNPDESYTRDPDLSGAFVQHANVVAGKLFSPGTKTDGSSF